MSLKKPLSWFLLLVIVGGLFFRFSFLGSFPEGMDNDEALEAQIALDVLDGERFHLYSRWGYSLETLNGYFVAPFLHFVGREISVLRLYSSLVGVLTILGLFLWVRRLISRDVAVLSAALLTFSSWHFFYSRIAFRAILAPCFAVWAAFFLTRFLQRQKLSDLFVLGILQLGGVLSYTAYRPIALALFLTLLLASVTWRKKRLATGMAFVAPAVLYAIIANLDGLSVDKVITRGFYSIQLPNISYTRNLLYSVFLFFHRPPGSYFDGAQFWGDAVHLAYHGGMFLPAAVVVSLFYLAGIGRAVHQKLWAPLLIHFVPLISLGFAGPSYTRLLVVLPSALVLAAFGISFLQGFVNARAPKKHREVAAASLLLIAVVASVYDLFAWRRRMTPEGMAGIFCRHSSQFSKKVAERLPPKGDSVWVQIYYCADVPRFVVGRERDLTIIVDRFSDYWASVKGAKKAVSVFLDGGTEASAESEKFLRKLYPQAEVKRFATADGIEHVEIDVPSS
jgi:hypothetical protein